MASERRLTVYRSSPTTVETRYDRGQFRNSNLVTSLVTALAEAEDVDPSALLPLHDTIDLEALERLIESYSHSSDSDMVLGFRVGTWNVFVRGDGKIRICDASRSIDPVPV
jgi:hypothetical protein